MLHVVLFLKKKHIVTPLYGTENIYLEDKCIFFLRLKIMVQFNVHVFFV